MDDLRIAEAKRAEALRGRRGIPPSIGSEGDVTRVVLSTIQLDDQPVAHDEIDSPDQRKVDLLAAGDARPVEPPAGDGLEPAL